jgi:hypothetical protein
MPLESSIGREGTIGELLTVLLDDTDGAEAVR